MQWAQCFCCWRHHRNWLFWIMCTAVSKHSWILGMSLIQCPCNYDFILGLKRKSQRGKSVRKEQIIIAVLLAAKNYCCFCSVVNNQVTNFAETHCKLMCFLTICWWVPYKRLNSTVISEIVLCQSSLTISWTFSSFSPTQPVEVWHEHLQSSTKDSSCLNLENHSKDYSLHVGQLLKAMHFWCSFPIF